MAGQRVQRTGRRNPDGGLVTTTSDLARLLDSLVGGRLVSPETFAAMASAQ